MELKIDKEFQGIIHPLTDAEFKQLEANILTDGCRDPLSVWDGTIIDGHHRYQICQQYNLKFDVHCLEFSSREDAVIWICQNQRGRRNISEEQREYLLGKEYEASKGKWGRSDGGNKKVSRQSGDLLPGGRTVEKMADLHGVGAKTVERSGQFAKSVDAIAQTSPTAKQKILSGESGITKKEIRAIYKKPQGEVAVIAQQIETGTYRKPDIPAAQNLKPEAMKQRIDEAVRSMRDPTGKQITSDSHAGTVARNLLLYANAIHDYISDNYPDIGQASSENKRMVSKSVQALESAINTLKDNIKLED